MHMLFVFMLCILVLCEYNANKNGPKMLVLVYSHHYLASSSYMPWRVEKVSVSSADLLVW